MDVDLNPDSSWGGFPDVVMNGLRRAIHLKGHSTTVVLASAWGRWKEIMKSFLYTEALRREVQLRSLLLDDLRRAFLRDVWSIKRALTGTMDDDERDSWTAGGDGSGLGVGGGAQAADADPNAMTTATAASTGGAVTIAPSGVGVGPGGGGGRSLPDPMRMVPPEVHGLPSIDLRSWGGPTKTHLEQFDDLERRGYLPLAGVGRESMAATPGNALLEKGTVPLYAPDTCAFLAHRCRSCQGVMSLVFARNERVEAALGLVHKWEKFQQVRVCSSVCSSVRAPVCVCEGPEPKP